MMHSRPGLWIGGPRLPPPPVTPVPPMTIAVLAALTVRVMLVMGGWPLFIN